MNKKLKNCFFICTMLIACVSLAMNNNVYGEEGGGGDSSGSTASCSSNALTLLCGNPLGSAGGGASWKIFSTSSGWGLDDYTGYGSNILQESYKASAMSDCSSTGWFASFGWDGMYGSYYGYDNFSFQIGPANREKGNLINNAVYNNYNLKSYDDLMRDGFSNNTRISDQTALSLYKRLHPNATSIPSEVGYFCAANNEMQGAATADEINVNTNPNTNTEPSKIAGVDTGWTQTTMTEKVYRINNCPATGCLARLGLWLRWKNGNQDATYKYRIMRRGVWTDWVSATASKPGDADWKRVKGLFDDTTSFEGKTYRWGIEKLYPGESVCYEMEFLKYASSGDPVYVAACAVANSGPGSSGDESTKKATLSIKVKNNDVRKYNSFQNLVYAKPGDKITYQTVYDPAPQSNYSLAAPQAVRLSCANNSNPYLFYGGQLGSLVIRECGSWKNAFTIQRKTSTAKWSAGSSIVAPAPYIYDAGSSSKKTEESDFNTGESTIVNGDIGKEYDDRAILNVGDGARLTPSEIKTIYGRGDFVENIYLIQLSSSSNATIDVDSAGVYYSNDNPAPNYRPVVLWSQYSAMNQQWIIRKTSDGYYTLTNMNSGKALDVPYANPTNNPQLWVFEHNSSCAQKWKIVDNKDGTYTFLSACNENYAIDAYNGSSGDGTVVWMYEKNGTPAQKWKLVPLNNSYNSLAEVKTEQTSSNDAVVRVPYNFVNESAVTTDPNTPLYAGEVATFSSLIKTLPRQNDETDGNYATKVPQSKHKFEICVDSSCEWFGEKSLGVLNSSSSKTGAEKSTSDTFTIPDISAGRQICLRSAIWPANSGAHTNFSDKKGSDTWYYSPKVCYKVAKKPSLQVWGGNIYSSGNINTALADKKNLAGYNAGDTHAFGSWGEFGIIASGTIKGLSSGASLGYSGLGLERAPGGSTSSKLCDNSPLSLANENCNSNYVGMINAVSANNPAANVINKDRDAIIRKFSFKDGENNSNILYEYNAGNYEIGEETINKSIIKVYQSDETITITGNLSYEDAQYSYTRNGNNADGDFLPKLVIIAKNINIACNVNRIDGVLLAESTVTTSKCEGSEDINARVNSNPLTINGAVIAGRIIPNRTYGAGPGNNSMVSAETINFDPSLYLWGQLGSKETEGSGEDASSGSGGKRDYLDLTYTRELAPRY